MNNFRVLAILPLLAVGYAQAAPGQGAISNAIGGQEVVDVEKAAAPFGMTFSRISHDTSNGVDLVGCDGCNAYNGDTSCNDELPILCISIDATQADPGVNTSATRGWSSGTVVPTLPIRGLDIGSIADADDICELSFGSNYQMAEFHDGGTGWNFYGYGDVSVNSRFWVFIDDQANGNCFAL